jgi:heterotetrameric sarcosine oxidase delta subunit
MRIPCPYCGPRSNEEFTYYGDATLQRPDAGAAGAGAESAVYNYVYLRNNPAGLHRELWFHAAGCHAWLVVERDTRTHAIASARPARTQSAAIASDKP